MLFLASMPFWYNVQPTEKAPKKLDWTPSFKKTETKPYASLAVYYLLPDIFPQKKVVQRAEIAPEDSSLRNLGDKYNLFFANRYMDTETSYTSALYFFVSGGGEAFIATTEYDFHFAELLGDVSMSNHIDSTGLKVNFTNLRLKAKKPYHYPNITNYNYFSRFNEEETTILATDKEDRPVLIKVPIGNGHFYLCSIPLAFTNFGMIDKRNHEFIAKSLSYMPIRDVLWEDLPQFKRKSSSQDNKDKSPEGIKELAFLKKHESLWWAFLLACASVVVFIIFRAKREQRPIPVLERPVNSSVEFAQTIGRLYFNYQDHKNLAEKKILYFFDFVRNHLQIPLHDKFDNQLIQRVAQKSSVKEEEVDELFKAIKEIRYKRQLSSTELAHLNTKINEFKRKCI